MIHMSLLEQLRQRPRPDRFIYPAYGSTSIAEVVPTVQHLFGMPVEKNVLPMEYFPKAQTDKIVLLVVDGFGFADLLRHGVHSGFFRRFVERGQIYPLTSVFPSTTPAALTTLHTGLTPAEHGLPEWFTYFPELERIVMPMEFRSDWSEPRDYLLQVGGTPDMVYAGQTLYQQLAASKIRSFVFVYHEYYPSVYSSVLYEGATIITYHDGYELMDSLRQALSDPGPAYYHVYWGQVDRMAHRYGPGSQEHKDAIKSFAHLIGFALLDRIDPAIARDVLLLMTADHGQVGIKHEDIIFLNDYPIAREYFATTSSGKPILPTGSPNDVFLHLKPGRLGEALRFLRHEFAGIAQVFTTEEAINARLFGPNNPTERFLGRIGNALIVPYPGCHIWYTEIPQHRYGNLGIHGGLSEDEMVVPLGVANLADLR